MSPTTRMKTPRLIWTSRRTPKKKTKEEVDNILRPEQLPVDGKLTTETMNFEKVSLKYAASKKQAEENGDETVEFVIDSIVAHKVNKSRRHRFAKKGETLFRIRWYGYESDDDTWEPIQYLPWSKKLSHCKKIWDCCPGQHPPSHRWLTKTEIEINA